MATLEVHDGQGRVERVTVARDQTLMFGSSPKCDIVLTGPGIVPFHGRIRWRPQKERFKVDASPDGRYVLVNGHKMSSSSLNPGDEIEVGGNRIFLINEGDAVPTAPTAAPRDDATRVQGPVFLAPPTPGTVIRRGSAYRPTAAESFAPTSLEARLESVVDELDDPGPSARGAPAWTARPSSSPSPSPSPTSPGKGVSTAAPERGWKRLLYLFSKRATTPGREEVLSSPLIFSLGLALVCLLVVGTALYAIIVRTASARLFTTAVENLQDGDYRNALRRFDEFIESNPNDPRTGQARVHRAMANVRQYTGGAGASWLLALEAEKAMLETVGQEPTFRDSSPELDEQVLRTGEELADRARAGADSKTLADAEAAVTLHNRLAGGSAATLLGRSRLPAKLDAARAAVRKRAVRGKALAAMDAALQARSTPAVYAARDALVAAYGDQAVDRDLLARMNQANDLVRKGVTVDPSGRPAETEPLPDPLGPPTSLVIRGEAPRPATPAGPIVFALVDGLAYGLDGATGAPVWQRPVGLSAPFPPLAIPGGSTALVVDARHDELIRIDGKTGTLVWRQPLGEPVAHRPLVLGNQVIQPTPSGKLLFLDVNTGALQATVALGMPPSGTPVSDESGQALYVTARRDCLFVLTRDPLACAGVVYLGHGADSIACPPARIGRYLIVPENHRIDEGRWRIFVINEDPTKLAPVQEVPVAGWTWSTPASGGSVVWSLGDRGGPAAFAVGAYGEKEPFRLIARLNPDARASGPAYALARSERELWVGSGRSGRYDLDPEGSRVQTPWTMADAGRALEAPQAAGPLVVLTQENLDGPGATLLGIESQTGAVAWRTILGAAWPSPPTAVLGDDRGPMTALGVDGGVLSISAATLATGGFVTSPLPRPGEFRLPGGALARLDGPGWTAIVPQVGSDRVLARAGASGRFQEVRLPAPVGARPIAWGRGLFLPGSDGRAYLVDPLTGESTAAPFIPSFDRIRPTRWRGVVALGPDAVALADEAGRVRRLVRADDPRPRLVVSREVALGKPLETDPASATEAVVLVTADGQVRSLASRDFSPVGAWALDAPLAAPPTSSGGRVFVADLAGGVLALGENGQRLWSIKLPGGSGIVGTPTVARGAVYVVTRDGVLHVRAIADGAEVERRELGVLATGGPAAMGETLVIPAGLGALRPLLAPRAGPSSATAPATPGAPR